MTECRFKNKNGVCTLMSETAYTYKEYCHDGPCTYEEPLTNGDLVRRKSNEEMARYYAKRIVRCYGCEAETEDDCYECQLEWLRKEANL